MTTKVVKLIANPLTLQLLQSFSYEDNLNRRLQVCMHVHVEQEFVRMLIFPTSRLHNGLFHIASSPSLYAGIEKVVDPVCKF